MVNQAALNQILNDGPTGRGLRKRGSLLACLLLVLGVAAQAWADVIVLQPFDPTRAGAFSNLVAGEPVHQQSADNFSLSQATALQSISWFGRYDAVVSLTNPVAFSVRFFADAGGFPSVSPLAVFDVMVNALDTGLTFGGTSFFSYSIPLALALDPGTYWVSVVESDPRSPGVAGSQWLWDQSSTSGVRATRNSDSITWTVTTGPDQAFTLVGNLGFQWPLRDVGVDAISQDYAQFNGVNINPNHYHTGLDIGASLGTSVYPTANGEVVEIQENGGQVSSTSKCKQPVAKGQSSNCSDHGYGNTVIIRHALGGGMFVYSQYSHLDKIAENLKGTCTPLDSQTKRRICSPPVPISVNDSLGEVGGSCYGDPHCVTVHLHFEIKNFPTLGTKGNDLGEWGYTASHPDDATDDARYIDPILMLHTLDEANFPRNVAVVEDGVCTKKDKDGCLRFGPGGLNTFAYPSFNNVDAGQYEALRKSGPSTDCPEGWYQIRRTVDECDIAGNCFVLDSDKKSSVPDAWVCGRFISG